MRYNTKYTIVSVVFLLMMLYSACVYDLIPTPPGPIVPKATDTLQAVYVKTAPANVSSSYWLSANYHEVNCVNLSTGNLYPDGFLNMTGTYTGLSDFNEGNSPNLIMKAAYDSVNLYIYLEWSDSTFNIANSNWYYGGPPDPQKSDSTGGWTSQKNNDKVSLEFEIQPASGPTGTFNSLGCAASCHNNQMSLTSGSVDIWNWNLALSEPMGYANDMVITSSGLSYDAGQTTFVRNAAGATSRSDPANTWNGVLQTVTRGDGSSSILDPAYYLYNKTPFTGNMVNGDSAYHNITYGCWNCHANNGGGNGPLENGVSFINNPNILRFSWQTFYNFATSLNHDGAPYFAQMTPAQQTDVFAFIRGFAGLPGYSLQEPTGSGADIISSSNVNLVNVNSLKNTQRYKVVLTRKLNTGNPDDAVFNPTQTSIYTFGVALMDNDGLNHIGSLKETLQFLKK